MNRKTIAILGAGFGGLRTALLIGKKIKKLHLTDHYRILLIDQNDYHTYTPTLYEIATTSKEVANQFQLKEIVTFPVAALTWGAPVEFLKAKVESVDPLTATITCSNNEKVVYSHLVIALGAQPNYFNIPGLEQNSFSLKSFTDAIKIREKIATILMYKENKSLNVIVGGGGSTGVEFAAELQTWLCEVTGTSPKTCWAHTTIVEGGPSVLAPFDKKIIAKAQTRLEKLGISTLANERIASVSEKIITLASGKTVPYDVLIWTGGIKPNVLLEKLPLKREEKSHRVLATMAMECLPENSSMPFAGKIYGIGDAMCVMDDQTGKMAPAVARAALTQASIVSENIIQDISLSENIIKEMKPLHYQMSQYPYVIPIGGKWAVAKLGTVIISGFAGWVLKGLVELNYLLSIMSPLRALKLWFKGLRIFIQNDRLG